jgi:hypothetical protein
MAWLNASYVTNMIGSAQADALGLTTTSGTVITDRFTQYELGSRSAVLAAMQWAGYAAIGATLTSATDAEAVTTAYLQRMVAALMVRDVFALIPGIELTDGAIAAVNAGLNALDGLTREQDRLPIPGLEPTALDAIGGSKFNVDGSYLPVSTKPVFRALRGSGF